MKETRQPFLLGVFIVLSILGFSFYLEYVKNIYPCPLCELQRFTFALLGFFFFIGTLLHRYKWVRYLLWVMLSFVSCFGIALATKQVWLQHFPETAHGVCGASVINLLQMLPLKDVITQIFSGSADCTERGWDFLMLDLAEWALISFVLFLLFSLFSLIKEWRHK